ncbi:MAG TPA: hypothetical protein VNW72_00190 [Chthoniobacterales bacterium]|jgi:hypothetical protein|nr:hypothetical protein [Chthoniobacterales bacterium]
MKAAVFAIALMPLASGAAEPPLLPTTEGTTWNYDLVQERTSDDLDLTEPNEEEHLSVSYRLGGTEKIDNKDLRRLEIYRGETLESVDLIAVEERGIICPARTDAQGAITKLVPPQIMLSAPLKKGRSWNFDGAIADTQVNQRYQIAGEEDVDVPAGKFHAWRIHCEQTLPAPATIDRWFVPGTGFVKVVTRINGPSGLLLQKTALDLKERPKITSAPQKNATPQSEKFSAGVSSEPTGESKAELKADTPAIYARWRGQGLPDYAQIRAVFIAENVADVTADYEIDDSSSVAPAPNAKGTFTLSEPEGGWAPGNYRLEFFVDDALTETVKFKILK